MDYSKIFIKIRKIRGLNQAQLAVKLGCTETYISYIETGLRKPSSTFLDKLCYELKIPAFALWWLTAEDTDVVYDKRESFRILKPVIDNIVNEFIVE